jgi:AAA family ATP:ADP antiporter
MNRLGVGAALLVLPVIGVLGFAALYFTHSREGAALAIVTVCLIAWRGLSHATQRPAREALYVPTERVEKYKAKSFTDTFAFRGGDLAGAYAFDAFSLTTAALVGLPLAAAWGGLGALLARRQSQLVAARSERDATT